MQLWRLFKENLGKKAKVLYDGSGMLGILLFILGVMLITPIIMMIANFDMFRNIKLNKIAWFRIIALVFVVEKNDGIRINLPFTIFPYEVINLNHHIKELKKQTVHKDRIMLFVKKI